MAATIGGKRFPVTFHPHQARFTIAYGVPSRSALYRLFNSGALTTQKLGGTAVREW
jgi:hypothetical protein